MEEDQGRYPRLGVALDVTLEAAGDQCRGRILDLRPETAKVRFLATTPESVVLSLINLERQLY